MHPLDSVPLDPRIAALPKAGDWQRTPGVANAGPPARSWRGSDSDGEGRRVLDGGTAAQRWSWFRAVQRRPRIAYALRRSGARRRRFPARSLRHRGRPFTLGDRLHPRRARRLHRPGCHRARRRVLDRQPRRRAPRPRAEAPRPRSVCRFRSPAAGRAGREGCHRRVLSHLQRGSGRPVRRRPGNNRAIRGSPRSSGAP
jgi:hypothetical protein